MLDSLPDLPGDLGVYLTTGDHVDLDVGVDLVGLSRSACKLTHKIVPDKPGVPASTVTLTPAAEQKVGLIDGRHTFVATCTSGGHTFSSSNAAVAMDRQPERCLGFTFTPSTITAASLQEVQDAIVGTWEGCVVDYYIPYWVRVTFRADATYSARSGETLDGETMHALPLDEDADSPNKTYALTAFQANHEAVGDIEFGPTPVIHDELRHVALMGDTLSFEYWHDRTGGPLTFQLHRV